MMIQKLCYSLVLLGVAAVIPSQAMDIEKVNALAEQIKAGTVGVAKSVKSVTQTTQAEPIPEVVVEDVPVKEDTPTLADVTPAQTAVSSSGSVKGTVSEESLGLRKTNLYTEDDTKPVKAKYTAAAPGTSKRFDRAYENAPPMIPHSVDGLLPITKKNNACLGCHMPDIAPSMSATPIPPSHFTNFRPMTKIDASGKMIKEGVEISNTSDIKIVARQEAKLYQGRYNCSQCHAPQAEIKPLVANTFTPDYRNPDEKHKSNLLDVINEGVE
jgi:cytochrome c-type protein NapB